MNIQQPRTKRVFRKGLAPAAAEAETSGWHQVAGHLPVPDLLGRTRLADRHLVAYQDVFAGGRCDALLGDLIAGADRDPATVPRVEALIDAVCDSLLAAVEATGRLEPLSACVPGLYADRIRPGGRIDTWYLGSALTIPAPRTGTPLPLAQLNGYALTVNDLPLRLDLPQIVLAARDGLRPDRRWITAITQGDPTEPNIADPLCWLDFEYAGRNTLVGEIANLLWYLLAMGGWLVPTYQPDVYARTLHLHLPPCTTPHLAHVEQSTRHRRLEVHYTWPVGPGREAAITRLTHRIRTDLANAAGLSPDGFLAEIRHFLTMRILGVIPPARLTDSDLLLLLAKLAQAQDPETIGETFTRTDPYQPSGPDDGNDHDHTRAA
ncbi:hypothetical protein P3T36_002784 [Kitasatospora sp. MAP12-15]|uniref:hypothetical protein n=1 Tax=unclassified Kitasatospora TaxID=2633591 RepID=UPI002474895F|nr:hypothetical protein [Kitasatospora sp. MAP12-44]MDH6113963.1 hypothetical protein [Kitasatospora sp. MAP12-44]